MKQSWNALVGELRSSLAARDWSTAGAIVWRLRLIDPERFSLELEHYTTEQVRRGGQDMALETEQRLEAVRQLARRGFEWSQEFERGEATWLAFLERLLDGSRHKCFWFLSSFDRYYYDNTSKYLHCRQSREPLTDLDFSCLDWDADEDLACLRSDMKDVIWSVLQEYKTSQPGTPD